MLPAVLVLLAACLGAVQVVGQHVRVTEAAGSAARLLARGESAHSAAVPLRDLGPSATLTMEAQGSFICAGVSADSAFAPFAAVGLVLSARSCALAGGP